MGVVLWGRREANIEFCLRDLRERDLGDPSVDGRIILRWIFRKLDVDRAGSG
jgi:hypothetical protein